LGDKLDLKVKCLHLRKFGELRPYREIGPKGNGSRSAKDGSSTMDVSVCLQHVAVNNRTNIKVSFAGLNRARQFVLYYSSLKPRTSMMPQK
jgi:hypothetical protein